LSHLWQRFVLAAALVFGLALGVAATVFGYSNTRTVDVGFSVLHLKGIPLWTVAIVPLVVVLAAGTLYHWWNGLHHFSEHMRHRRRVRELEAELASVKSRLDELLEMPGHAETSTAPPVETIAPVEEVEAAEPVEDGVFSPHVEPPASDGPVGSNGNDKNVSKGRKREVVTTLAAETLPMNGPLNREDKPEPTAGS
jgi:hypothetical protein